MSYILTEKAIKISSDKALQVIRANYPGYPIKSGTWAVNIQPNFSSVSFSQFFDVITPYETIQEIITIDLEPKSFDPRNLFSECLLTIVDSPV